MGSDDQTPTPAVVSPLAAWGDSLTAGAGGTPYPAQLAKVLNREVRNFGIGGQVAAQIAARQGGTPVTLTVQGNAFNGANPVAVTAISIQLLSTPSSANTNTIKGTVAGVPATLTRTAAGTSPNYVESYTLIPTAASTTAIPANSQFIPDDAVANKGLTQILWYGRNDTPVFTTVLASIQASVAYLSEPKQFVVIGVLNALTEVTGSYPYGEIDKFNKNLSTAYPNNYVVITPPTDAEMTAISYTPTAQDKANIAKGTFPTGLFYADGYHLNTLGYQIIANRVAAFLTIKGW